MLLERLLRHGYAKQPFIPSSVFCSFWREVIRQRIRGAYMLPHFHMDREEVEQFESIFIEPYKDWTRAERIKHSHMVQDLLAMSAWVKRADGEPMSVHQFMGLLDTYEKDVE